MVSSDTTVAGKWEHCFVSARWRYESRFPSWPPLTPEEKGALLGGAGVGVPNASARTLQGGVPHYRRLGFKVLTHSSAFSESTAVGTAGEPYCGLARVEVKVLHLAFTGVSEGGGSQVLCGGWLRQSGYYLKVVLFCFVLSCQAAPFLVLWLQRVSFLGFFSLCT